MDQPSPRTAAARRRLLQAAALWPWAATAAATESPRASPGQGGAPWRIAFGSCARQGKPQPIWAAVAAARPDLFVFLGDNFYADAATPEALRARHAEFAREAVALQAFRRRVPHLATWDDHDYGLDDAGAEYPHRRLSQQLFCDTWGEPADSPRRQRDGIYTAQVLEAHGRRVQLLLPDLRFNRGALSVDPAKKTDYENLVRTALRQGAQAVPGWYRPSDDPRATMLGAAQWQWLEAQLAQPADLRILCSSVQLAAEGTGWECWWNFPADRARLADALRRHRVEGLVTISGDMHYGEVSRLELDGLYPLWDITSSGLTEVWAVPTPNTRRVGAVLAEPNFGLIEIDWQARALTATVRRTDGSVGLAQRIAFDTLRLPPAGAGPRTPPR